MERLAKEKLQGFIKEFIHPGSFFTVTFFKKDDSLRRMTCRTGVDKRVSKADRKNPERLPYSHTRDMTRANITVWEIPRDKKTGVFCKGQYRAIPLNRVVNITYGGKTFYVC